MLYRLLVASLWYILPAYVANASACIFGGGTPVDLGKNFIDGRRLLGNGVTYKGCAAGIICGTFIGLIQGVLVDFNVFNSLDFYGTVLDHVILALFLSVGAIVGDAIGSFIKRRLNIERGKPAPLLDQLDFVIGALAFGYVVVPISHEMIIIICLFTVFVHLFANIIAYKLGIKEVWW